MRGQKSLGWPTLLRNMAIVKKTRKFTALKQPSSLSFHCLLPKRIAHRNIQKMLFKQDFETNDIWKHFKAVQEGRVYDLPYSQFGMSATFAYPDALNTLQPMLYPESDDDAAKAKENSDNAAKAAENSNATDNTDPNLIKEAEGGQ